MTLNYVDEETILTPADTSFDVEGQLDDVKHFQHWNQHDNYVFTFQPKLPHDYNRIYEAVENAVMMVEMRKSPYSNKVAVPKCENKWGHPMCSQVYLPKLNIEFERSEELQGRDCLFTLNLRDAPDGSIYLNADYILVYPKLQPKAEMMDILYDDTPDW